MTFKNYLLVSLLTFVLILTSCNDDSSDPGEIYSNGVFISCEGTFNASNASVSFYSYNADSVINNIFKSVNNRSLGDVAQSITIHDNKAFIVVNNSNKVEVVDAHSFVEIATLTDLSMPRYLVVKNNKAYISCWGDQSVSIIDLNTLEILKRIPAGIGPEKMLIHGNKLFVANTNAYDDTIDDSTLTVINLDTDELIVNLNTGAHNPVDLEIDKKGNLWTLCRGAMNWDNFEQTPSQLVKIDPENLEVVDSYELFADAHPANLTINSAKDKLYYGIFFMRSGIFEVSVDEPGQGDLFLDVSPYGFEIIPPSGELFISKAADDFVSNGSLDRYSASGELLGSYITGINGNGMGFKNAE